MKRAWILIGLLVLILTWNRLGAAQPAPPSSGSTAESQLGALESEERRLLTELDELEKSLAETENRLAELEEEALAAKTRLQAGEKEIVELEGRTRNQKKFLSARLRAIYRLRDGGFLAVLVKSESVVDMVQRYRYLTRILKKDETVLREYQQRTTTAKIRQDQVRADQTRLYQLKMDLAARMDDRSRARRRMTGLLIKVHERKEVYLTYLKLEEERRQKTIRQAIGDAEAEAGDSKAPKPAEPPPTAASKKTDTSSKTPPQAGTTKPAESSSKPGVSSPSEEKRPPGDGSKPPPPDNPASAALNPNPPSSPSAGSEPASSKASRSWPEFEAQKGRLLSPVFGRIVSGFGPGKGEFGVSLNRQGVVYETQAGNSVQAVAPGEVLYVGWLKGYGNIVILDHGRRNYTLTGGLAGIRPQPGQWVEKGQILGRAPSGGQNEKKEIYFEIRRGGRAVDPAGWMAGGPPA
jgi:septal ring factor EnvC (AmiA/AmiB activator)